eukprot:TRINITY_DN58331_c0_g1_i1.p1 TRINITY_DN58331_c0_g1~~TRINITY_DN58331_c0_g1_i1.p1  ORF type:complete len:134 (+),score=8.05 TRINITY_DN58331_c0_g1_i1:134-535(+)
MAFRICSTSLRSRLTLPVTPLRLSSQSKSTSPSDILQGSSFGPLQIFALALWGYVTWKIFRFQPIEGTKGPQPYDPDMDEGRSPGAAVIGGRLLAYYPHLTTMYTATLQKRQSTHPMAVDAVVSAARLSVIHS